MGANMKVRMITGGGLSRVAGLRAAGVACGIKTPGKRDLALVVADRPASVAATFTTNLVQAAPVTVSKRHLRHGRFSAIVLNSGNANACTGAQGLKDAEAMARATARLLACPIEEVFVASTGVIGRPMPMAKIHAGIVEAVRQLTPEGGGAAAQAIMTTDTVRKEAAATFRVGGGRVAVAGMAKGSGMIAPNMATMLAVVATDATLSSGQLQRALDQAVATSFNCITVDGDTSTNDMVVAFATGAADAPRLTPGTAAFRDFQAALDGVCLTLAKAIVRDGEGATKLAEVVIRGARSATEARRGAEAVATSPLVKTTLAGEDINWGRILAAVGRSGARFDPDRVDITVDRVAVVRSGRSRGVSAEASANRRLKRAEYTIAVDLHAGSGTARLWTTDLTEAYVRINAGYRS